MQRKNCRIDFFVHSCNQQPYLHMRTNLLFLALFLSSALHAFHGGTIRGLVTNPQGEPLVGASVRLEEKKLFAVTDPIGVFVFSDLPNGQYTLSVSYLGYELGQKTVQVANHETTVIQFELAEKRIDLQDVEIRADQPNPLQTISQIDIRLRPVQSSQDILRMVPGLFIGQHAGGGKAEQIFLRGFDIDHGTDIALFADGIPVNMVSHAHGQGYADLHFLIPELVQRIDFEKGMYDARTGNFATAGQVRFETPKVLDQNFIKLEAGQFDTYRMATAINLLGKTAAANGTSAYLAGEQLFTNAYFDAPQLFRRQNYFGKFNQRLNQNQSFSLSLSSFKSSWLASGQIPERAVNSGLIGPYGAIDATEGGATSRYNLNAQHWMAVSDKTSVKNQFYYARYNFELYSNFTFFLEDPVNGDQIRQKEQRDILGINSTVTHQATWNGRPLTLEGGIQFRSDEVLGNELSRTRNRRETLSRLALGDVQEMNASVFAHATYQWTPSLSLNLGARFDQFHHQYQNNLDSAFTTAFTTRNQASPKASIQWQATDRLKLFFRTGSGFHSNDTRVVLFSADQNILPRAWGQDLGAQIRPLPRLLLSATGWHLALEQEFVYVGDAGVVEPGGKTQRYGVDLSARWQFGRHLFLDADYTWTKARAVDEPEGGQNIPLAPIHTAVGGLNWVSDGFSASLRTRWLGDRPANEDYSITAKGYFLLDAQVSFSPMFSKNRRPLEFSLSAQNLGNVLWYEAQFDTESRLAGETEPVSEIHFTPGTPLWVKGGIMFKF